MFRRSIIEQWYIGRTPCKELMEVHQQPTASKHGKTDEKAANVWWFEAICVYLIRAK